METSLGRVALKSPSCSASQPIRRSLLSQPMRRSLLCVLLKLLGGRELLGVHAPHALCRSSRAWLG